MMHPLYPKISLTLIFLCFSVGFSGVNLYPRTAVWKDIETQIFKNYERRHRPVKHESATIDVDLSIGVNHIDEINESEQTMQLHGHLWASWNDEYLQWDPAAYNGTKLITVDPWKPWMPAFALYNNARSNQWQLQMNGYPVAISAAGRVYAMGYFSFFVTCAFDFSNYPNDVQNCPIVLAEWVYDLSKVNLKPTSKISYVALGNDAMDPFAKRHTLGWEVQRSTQSVCYYGPNGCEAEFPSGADQMDNYWSLVEYNVAIRRHAPYYFTTILFPMIMSTVIALSVFWIDDGHLAVVVCVAALMFETALGRLLFEVLPPSTGSAPRIVTLYTAIFLIELFILSFHVGVIFTLHILSGDTQLPFQLTSITKRLRELRAFKAPGFSFSFDPQRILNVGFNPNTEDVEQLQTSRELEEQRLESENQNQTQTVENSLFEMDPIPLDDEPVESTSEEKNPEITTLKSSSSAESEDVEAGSISTEKEQTEAKWSPLEAELQTLRRAVFFIILFLVFILLLVFG